VVLREISRAAAGVQDVADVAIAADAVVAEVVEIVEIVAVVAVAAIAAVAAAEETPTDAVKAVAEAVAVAAIAEVAAADAEVQQGVEEEVEVVAAMACSRISSRTNSRTSSNKGLLASLDHRQLHFWAREGRWPYPWACRWVAPGRLVQQAVETRIQELAPTWAWPCQSSPVASR